MITPTIGPHHTLAQNVVYALPVRACHMFTGTTTGFEVSVNHSTGFTGLTITNHQALVGPGFIRNTTSSPVVYFKSI